MIAEKKGNRSTHVDWDAAIRTMIIEDVDQTVTSSPGEKFLTEAEFAEEQEHGTEAEKFFLTKARCGNFKTRPGILGPNAARHTGSAPGDCSQPTAARDL